MLAKLKTIVLLLFGVIVLGVIIRVIFVLSFVVMVIIAVIVVVAVAYTATSDEPIKPAKRTYTL